MRNAERDYRTEVETKEDHAMKGTIKKLNLKRETLRELSRDEAQAVHGGVIWTVLVVIGATLSIASGTLGTNGETCSGYCSK